MWEGRSREAPPYPDCPQQSAGRAAASCTARRARFSNDGVALDPREKSRLVKDLMAARRAVKDAKGAGDHGAESEAHRMVDEASARRVSAGLSGGRTERRRLIAANRSTMRLRSGGAADEVPSRLPSSGFGQPRVLGRL